MLCRLLTGDDLAVRGRKGVAIENDFADRIRHDFAARRVLHARHRAADIRMHRAVLEGEIRVRIKRAVFQHQVFAVAKRLLTLDVAVDEMEVLGVPAEVFAVQRAVVAGDVLGVPEGVAGMDFGIEDFDIPAPLTEVVAVQLDVLQTDVRRVCEEVVALIERALFNENVSTGPKRFLGVRERTVADFNAVRIAEGLRALEPGVRYLEVLQVPETGAGGYLEKAVVDHGIGIDPEGILALNVAVGQREIRAVLDGRITGENRNVIEFGVRKLVKGAFAAESLISDELHDVPIFLLFFVVL